MEMGRWQGEYRVCVNLRARTCSLPPPPAPLRPPPCSDWEVSLVEFRVSLLENSKWRGTLGPGG